MTRFARWTGCGLIGAMGFLMACPLWAGPVFIAGEWNDGRFVRDAGVAGPWYSVRYNTTDIVIERDFARTKVEEEILGPERSVGAVAVFPLPEGTEHGSVRVTIGQSDRAPIQGARVLTEAEAQRTYEALAVEADMPGLLAWSGRPTVLIPRIAVQGKFSIAIEFRAPIRCTEGVARVACPLSATVWARGPVERLSLTATLHTREPLRAVFSPTHAARVQRKGLHEATATVKLDKYSGADDFRLYWVADPSALGLRLLSFRGKGEEDGFFMLVGNPTGSEADESACDKELLLVLDASGSMRGEKIEQARAAIDYCLQRLNPGDRFNVVAFGTEVRSFRADAVARSAETVAAARVFVESLVANGQTNICGALEQALAGRPDPARPRIMIFLTDGAPTAGELVPEKILQRVQQANRSGTKVFVMGVGHDVNAHLLDKLAELTDGSSEYVAPQEELDAKIAALYDRLSHPVLSNVSVSFGELRTHSVYPQKLPVLFKGSEVMVAGRFREPCRHTVTISGTLAGKPVQYTCTPEMRPGPDEPAHEFIAPLWAARKIGYLLQEIRLHGENQELIAEVVRLSRQYGIVTEYTEFLATRGGSIDGEEAVREARTRMSAARAEQAGQWAVNQAFNDRDLQQRAVAGREANVYRDRRGTVVAASGISQLGRRTFYLRGGQWVDAEEAGPRKTRTIQLFSPEYFALLRTEPEFARAQQLGWAVSINVGQERIVVEKNGKQQDESQLKPPEPQAEEAEESGQGLLLNQMQQQVLPQQRRMQNVAPQSQVQPAQEPNR